MTFTYASIAGASFSATVDDCFAVNFEQMWIACGQAPAWVLGELAEYSLGRVG